MPLVDSFSRTINYLRISVTDRCNFRCVYCMPEEGADIVSSDQLLTAAEIERLARVALSLGMSKFRITGGEPLVRKDIADIVAGIGGMSGVTDLSLTTNGFLLDRYAAEFAASGLHRVNISLDTLRPERFRGLARRGDLESVWRGIEASLAAGLTPIKINCVAMRGWNDDEAADFARLTLDRDIHVRFIELMPIKWSHGEDTGHSVPRPAGISSNVIRLFADASGQSFRSNFHRFEGAEDHGSLDGDMLARAFVSSGETRSAIEEVLGPLAPASVLTNGPARTFRIPGARGTVGFISQISSDLCESCNRLRLTADGQLRPCLMADGEVDLRSAMRSGSTDEEIASLFRVTVHHKPKEHRLEDGVEPTSRFMSQIGG